MQYAGNKPDGQPFSERFYFTVPASHRKKTLLQDYASDLTRQRLQEGDILLKSFIQATIKRSKSNFFVETSYKAQKTSSATRASDAEASDALGAPHLFSDAEMKGTGEKAKKAKETQNPPGPSKQPTAPKQSAKQPDHSSSSDSSEDDSDNQGGFSGGFGNGGNGNRDSDGSDEDRGDENHTNNNNFNPPLTGLLFSSSDSDDLDESDLRARRKRKRRKKRDAQIIQILANATTPAIDCIYRTLGCAYSSKNQAMALAHSKVCPVKAKADDDKDTRDAAGDAAMDKWTKMEIGIRNRPVSDEQDDNNMLLAAPRFWGFPNNWHQHQAKAINAQTGSQALVRWNYPFDRLGLTVRNKQVVIWVHNTKDRTILELKHFSTTNLALTSGKARPIQGASGGGSVAWQEEYDSISPEALSVAIEAWRNWVDLNRFIHPALMDCLAAFRCVQDSPDLTVAILCTFFTKHLENRATAATNGALSLWDHAGASQALAMIQTQASHQKPAGGKKFQNTNGNRTNTNSGNRPNGNQGGRGNQNGRGGKKQRGKGNRANNTNSANTAAVKPNRLQLLPNLGKKTLCLRFNRDKDCPNMNAGDKFCTRDGSNKRFWHFCALKLGNKACGSDKHKASSH